MCIFIIFEQGFCHQGMEIDLWYGHHFIVGRLILELAFWQVVVREYRLRCDCECVTCVSG